MANVSLDLAQFKSAGVYTLEYDESQRINTETTNYRLLVGFNGKGPYNRPVFLNSEQDRIKIFGDIDTRLERKGAFFNRMAQTLLTTGPIFALNLLKVSDDAEEDHVNFAAMSLNAGVPNPNLGLSSENKMAQTDYSDEDKLIYKSTNYDSVNKRITSVDTFKNIPYIGSASYASMYDRSRFWIPSQENLLANTAKLLKGDTTKTTFEDINFLNFANVGTKEFSILVFKPEALQGYDLTAKEWYGSEDKIPYKFIRPNDYMKDYFIQVVCVEGNWSNYKQLATDEIFGAYFNEYGIRKDKVNTFITTDGITLLGSWIGCIIPEFQDKVGNNENIVNKINNNTTVTGLLAAFNEDAAEVLAYDYDEGAWFTDLDNDGERDEYESYTNSKSYLIDMVGHNFADGYETGEYELSFDDENDVVMTPKKRYGINFLSYAYDTDNPEDILTHIDHATYLADLHTADTEGVVKHDNRTQFVIANKIDAEQLSKGDFVQNIGFAEDIPDVNGRNLYREALDTHTIKGITRITDKKWVNVTLTAEDKAKLATITKNAATVSVTGAKYTWKGKTAVFDGEVIYDPHYKLTGFYLYTAVEGVCLKETVETDSFLEKVEQSIANGEITFKLADEEDTEVTISATVNDGTVIEDQAKFLLGNGVYRLSKSIQNDNLAGRDSEYILTIDTTNVTNNFTINGVEVMAGSTEQTIALGDSTTFSIAGLGDGESVDLTNLTIRFASSGNGLLKQKSISDAAVSSNLHFIPMKGLEIQERHKPGYDEEGQIDPEAGVEKIYSMLATRGIRRGLCNPQMIEYRYIVDSMGYGLDTMMGGKVYLTQLAKKRMQCTAIVNMPSKKQFARSTDPYFCDSFVSGAEIKPAFDTAYIPLGGNSDNYGSRTFSLPDADNGATFGAAFWPWLEYTVNRKRVIVPPAADVCNAFFRKYQGADPFMIVANTNGVLSNRFLTGVEYEADTEDRDALEPFGVNTIITGGDSATGKTVMIYGNQTMYQKVKSDFNKLHVRENLNLLENETIAVLKNFVFKYNTPEVRADLVTKITPIWQRAQTSGAIAWFTIQCDDKNNTEEIIAEDYGIIDVTCEMNRGMEKIVQRIHVTRNSVYLVGNSVRMS
jgi:hypothetical protein